ncbi:MAG: hypothetical protein ACREVE_05055 [Gammaproteobacteria bacterium]
MNAVLDPRQFGKGEPEWGECPANPGERSATDGGAGIMRQGWLIQVTISG